MEEVLTVGWDRLNLSDSETTLENTSAVERAMQVLTDTPNLTRQQEKDSFVAEIRLRLGEK